MFCLFFEAGGSHTCPPAVLHIRKGYSCLMGTNRKAAIKEGATWFQGLRALICKIA
jgi:hypothetical protein